MSVLSVPAAVQGPARARTGTGWSRLLIASVLVWTGVCLAQTLASYSDTLAAGHPASFSAMLGDTSLLYLPWVAFTTLLLPWLGAMAHRLDSVPVFLIALAVASLGFMLPYEAYLVALDMHAKGLPWSEFAAQFRRHPAMFVFVDYILFLGCFSFVYAIALFQRALARERDRRRVEAENLGLRLQLEQGRLATLQAQLEPHFLFNCLNAISALIRKGEQSLALASVQRLGDLLRYAVTANGRESVSLEDEVTFVDGYVTLQKMRYGDRLGFACAVDPAVLATECPPLMLQPLVENAIRHGLECCTGPCRIDLSARLDGEAVVITVHNDLSAGVPANAGLGIGLSNIRDRLAAAYGAKAALATERLPDAYVATIRIPADGPGGARE